MAINQAVAEPIMMKSGLSSDDVGFDRLARLADSLEDGNRGNGGAGRGGEGGKGSGDRGGVVTY
jgi:hypothetical protein